MKKYDPKSIEKKWQRYWEKNKTFEVKEDPKKQKFYSLIEFPYPSGVGLHVGHPRPFTAMDVISRKKRMEGYNVLYPMGFDAFGLPTENFAIKTGRPPAEVTAENIANFTRQLKSLGYSFDWSRAVDTTDPKYYKWTQWIFLQFYKHGLAYKKMTQINWCPKDKIGLANEEAAGGVCDRCGGPVEKRNKEQWMLAITKYADKLLEGLKEVDYIIPARVSQENWIGRSEGAVVRFSVVSDKTSPTALSSAEARDIVATSPSQRRGQGEVSLDVFTTRPDTIFGATFVAISAELASKWIDADWKPDTKIKKYIEDTLKEQSKAVDHDVEVEKTGIDSGVKAINPANNEEIPIWITNYVLPGYGTGAIMAVPAHDERDFEFAKKYGLEIRNVIKPQSFVVKSVNLPGSQGFNNNESQELLSYLEGKKCYIGDGQHHSSKFLNALDNKQAIQSVILWLEEKGIGKRQVNYKLRDWVFSRQRYWGEPIPLVKCESCANTKQKVLIIHGFGGSGDGNWLPWMKQELEKKGFEVFAPTMSTSAHPNLESWMRELKPFVDTMGESDIIVGHSLGSKAALHLVEQTNKKIGNLYLVASAIGEMNERDWNYYREAWKGADVDALKKFWETPLNFNKITKLVGNIQVILSEDDPWIKKKTHENLPKEWDFSLWKGFGHFQAEQIPELLEIVLQSKNTGWIPLPESELPLKLPKVKKYEPTDTGESPLSTMTDWVNTTCPRCGGPAKRETDTMPNWAGSSWYFLRYCDPDNDKEFATMEKLKYWMGVDWYNGGMEHTVLHLLYSRFWNQFLFDIGLVPTREPYKKRTSHGMILGPDGEKMSKSRGNVINPDEMVEKFGADAFRTYIGFMGPFDQAVKWDTNGLVGVRRFLEKVWGLQERVIASGAKQSHDRSVNFANEMSSEGKGIATSPAAPRNDILTTLVHQTIKKVSNDIEKMSFNTAIAALMELTNALTKEEKISKAGYCVLIKLLSPFAPHIAEELWENFGDGAPLAYSAWPVYDEALTQEATLTIAVQINGKIRDEISVAAETSEDEIKKLALASEKVQKWLEGKPPKKVIYVKGKLVSIVV